MCRELSSGDRDQSRRTFQNNFLARHRRRRFLVFPDERAQSRKTRRHVGVRQFDSRQALGQHRDQIFDVANFRPDARGIAGKIRVGRTHQHVAVMRHHEHDSTAIVGQHNRFAHRQNRPRKHQMHALGQSHARLRRGIVHPPDVVHPRAGRVEKFLRTNFADGCRRSDRARSPTRSCRRSR